MSRTSVYSLFSRFEHLGVLAVYTLLALVMSYPLVAQFGDHIPGVDGDVWSYLWAMGWARAALLSIGTNAFHSHAVFYPLGGATQLLWGTALPSFASIPLQLALGLVPAFNVIWLAAIVLTGYGMYLLGKEVLGNGRDFSLRPGSVGNDMQLESGLAPAEDATTDSYSAGAIRSAAFVAGLVFTFCALRLGYGIAFTNLFHTEFIPFYVLFLVRGEREPGWKNAVFAGLFFALNVYVDFQIAAFLAIMTLLWFLYIFIGLAWSAFRAQRGISLASLHSMQWLVMGVTLGILSLPMLGFVLQDFAIEGGNYIRVYPLKYSAERSYDVLSFALPNARSTVYANLLAARVEGVNASVTTEGDSEFSPDRQSFVGVTVLVLVLLGIIRFRYAMGFWVLVTLVFAVLALGPVLHVAGINTNLPLPFALVNNIPILNHIRIPMRYGLMMFFGASLLAGAGALVLTVWQKWLVFPVTGLILLEAAVLPYPTLEFRVPPVYEQIAQDDGDFTVLEIPSFNWRFAAKNETWQAVHLKGILRAYTNRIAPDVADYFTLRQTPIVVRSLRILEGEEDGVLTEEELGQDQAALNDTMNFFNLRYAVMHRDQLESQRTRQIDAYLRDVLKASVFYQDDAVTAYRFAVAPAPEFPLHLDLADNSSLMYLGRGWQTEPTVQVDDEQGRYLKGARSEIFLARVLEDAHTIELRILAQGEPQELSLVLDGHTLAKLTPPEGWSTTSLNVAGIQPSRLHRLQILHAEAPETVAVGSMDLK